MRYLLLLSSLMYTFNLFSQDFNLRLIKTIPDNYPLVVTTLQVYDLNDDPIKDLKEENFNVSVNGKSTDSIKAITYKESGKGLNIMLCLDLSGTMRGTPLQTMKNAVLKFLDEMRNVDKLAIIGFSDSYELISDFSSDKEYLKNKINNLSTSGSKTALYYGTYQGLVKLRDNKELAGKILLVIGDGKDESVASSYSLDDVINLAKNEGIPIFSIGYSKIDKSYLQTLEKMSEQSGGKFYNSPTDNDLVKQYNKLYEQILNIYILSYLVVGLPGDGSEYNNVITVSFKDKKKTVSNKFISPAGVPAYNKKLITSKDESSDFIYYIIIASVILAGAVLFFVLKSRKKKSDTSTPTPYQNPDVSSNVEGSPVVSEQKSIVLDEPKTVLDKDNISDNDYKTEIDRTENISHFEGKTIIVRPDSASTLSLKVETGNYAGQSFYLKSKGGIIGRQDGNDIVIKENNISRQHAEIIFSNGEFFIKDLNSSNGTYINGIKINQQVKINNYDTFKIGSCEGRFLIS
jgi:VWFA-related protein